MEKRAEEDHISSKEAATAMMMDNVVKYASTAVHDDIGCPLFMEGLPKDFATNPSLAALASLLQNDEDDDNKNNEHDDTITNKPLPVIMKSGGGKLRRSKGRQQRQSTNTPYAAKNKNKTEETASLGEAQLFMKLWKL